MKSDDQALGSRAPPVLSWRLHTSNASNVGLKVVASRIQRKVAAVARAVGGGREVFGMHRTWHVIEAIILRICKALRAHQRAQRAL